MAKIFAAPSAIKLPDANSKNFELAEEKYLKDLATWCRERYSGPLVGEVIRTPFADGEAAYMILRQKPFCLLHLELGDGWRADEIWERGISLSDARKRLGSLK